MNGQWTEELNQYEEGFNTIFEERLMTLSESILSKIPSKTEEEAQNDERLKTLEERLMLSAEEIKRSNVNVSHLESKLNRSRAFGLV